MLNFNLQINAIFAKLSKPIGIFYKLPNFAPDFIPRLYYCLVYPT